MKRIIGTFLSPSNWLLCVAAIVAVRGDFVGALLCLGLAFTLAAGALLAHRAKQRA